MINWSTKKTYTHRENDIFFFHWFDLMVFFWLLAKLVVNIATIIMETAKNNTAQFLLLSHVVVVTQYNRGFFFFGIQQPKWDDDVRLFSIKSYRRTRTQTLFFLHVWLHYFLSLIILFSVQKYSLIFLAPVNIYVDYLSLSLSSCLFLCVWSL